jgi:hypothetical protein
MHAFYITLAVSAVLLLGAVTFLVLIVAGIRKRDRGDLDAPNSNRIDAIARRMTGLGIRKAERTTANAQNPLAITEHRVLGAGAPTPAPHRDEQE